MRIDRFHGLSLIAIAATIALISSLVIETVLAQPAASANAPQPGAPAKRSIWSGVYTADQAARGKKDYDLYCTGCHGMDLEGGDGPALAGGDFLRNWLEDDVWNLVEKVQQRMPGDAPGSLTMKEASDIVTFLFQANHFPEGSAEMPADEAGLSAIRIEGKDGPGPVPNFALVLVVGCLTEATPNQWTLTNGTEPVRTRESVPNPRVAGAPAPPLGTQSFRLMDVASARPQSARGQRVEVKGLLMRQPAGAAINVTSIQPVSPQCP